MWIAGKVLNRGARLVPCALCWYRMMLSKVAKVGVPLIWAPALSEAYLASATGVAEEVESSFNVAGESHANYVKSVNVKSASDHRALEVN